MMKKKAAIFLFCAAIYSGNTLAAENSNNTATQVETNTTQFQNVVEAYKAYLADVNAKTRDEVIAYRKEIARLNRLKREEYQKLSQDAQSFLAKEQEFKKKLPLKQRKLINITNPGDALSNKGKSQ